jgi:peroxiredoxin
MRRIFAVIPAAALAAALFAQAPAAKAPPAAAKKTTAAPVTPRKAGEFVIHMPNGSEQLLSSYRGKVVVMAFMYTTCTHCQHTAGVLAKVQSEYGPKGAQVIGVTFDQDAAKNVANFIKTFGVNFPCGYSTPDQVVKFLHAPEEYYVPMLAFIDQTGTVRSQYIVTGIDHDPAGEFLNAQEANIRKELDKYLKAPSPAAAKQAPKS